MQIAKKWLLGSLLLLSLATVSGYIVIRVALFFYSQYLPIEKFFSIILVLAELFVLIHSLGYAINILTVFLKKSQAPSSEEGLVLGNLKEEPPVAILVAARNEPRFVLEETFLRLCNLNYKNKEIYFLDDSSEEQYKIEAEEIAQRHNIHLFRRTMPWHGAKAGIINDCLKALTHKYIVIFDADQNPLPEFLNKVVPIMEANKDYAFVQTPQFYSNIEENRIARAAAFQQAVFYEYICEAKSAGNAMFSCGTNIIFRRQALLEVGGLDESTVTEDFATAVNLQLRGWRSFYYSHTYAFGMGPQDLEGYFRQQFRWATGTISVLKKIIWHCIRHPFSLKPFQWWEYFLSGSYYFAGIAFLIMMVCPVTYLFFKIPSFFSHPYVYLFAFMPYIFFSIGAFYAILGSRYYKIKDLFLGQLLGFCTFSVYARGALWAILNIPVSFGVTGKVKTKTAPYLKLWPQLSMLFLNFAAGAWGMNRFLYERNPAILVNSFWALYYFMILCGVFYFNQEDTEKIGCKALASDVKFQYQVVSGAHSITDLSKKTWQQSFKVFLPERVETGVVVTCGLTRKDKQKLVFEAQAIWSSPRKKTKGFETVLGIVAIPEQYRLKLKEFIA